MKKIYLVRHAKADGQAFEAPLLGLGRQQALDLKRFFRNKPIDRILSSPFTRAVQTIEPLALSLGIPVEIDDRLSERVFSPKEMENWKELLEQTFRDMDFCLEGGETNNSGLARVESLIKDLLASPEESVILVSHGNLSTLILHYIDSKYGFHDLMAMTNPDVFKITYSDAEKKIERIWS
ncbi:histidine phosphatase family protein [Peribacillus kribbensis]|uniref:histidine phosphatase family protein n=1 Tax=Peribacillus kribbensis TaxID=356658 RepID=UPI0004101BC4|nr:histidine phosphatase family protein [Peribacillus kribbensis]